MSTEGKLYRVRGDALIGISGEARANRSIVSEHGYLWVFAGEWEKGHAKYKAYKSITTGELSPFADYEMEELE